MSQRLHLDLAIAKLSVAAALLLVTPMRVGFAANRFPVRNLWSLKHYFRVITLLQLGDDDFNMLLASSGNEKFLRLRVAEEAHHLVLFHQPMKTIGQLVFIGPRLGLDGKGNRRLWERDLRKVHWAGLLSEAVACQGSLELCHSAEIAGM